MADFIIQRLTTLLFKVICSYLYLVTVTVTIMIDTIGETVAERQTTGMNLQQQIQADPEHVLQLLLGYKIVNKGDGETRFPYAESRIHLILTMIEEGLYHDNEEVIFALPENSIVNKRIHAHIRQIINKLDQIYKDHEDLNGLKDRLVAHYFPEQAKIIKEFRAGLVGNLLQS